MLIKFHELSRFNKNSVNYYLFYGPNTGLIDETINKTFKPIFTKNIITYDEIDLLKEEKSFKEMIFNKSFFEDEKFIIINRATNKILDLIKELIDTKVTGLKIIIKAGVLEKKSKLRSYFEKNKSVSITPFYEDNYQTLLLMIQKIFNEKKVKISSEIVNLIIERSKGNRTNIANEVEKILSYAKKRSKINLDDIIKLTNLAENYSISELVDQNLSKNKNKTINILNENNLNSEENILVIRTFLNKLKRLKNLKIELEKNKNIEQILASSKPPVFWKDKTIVKQQLNMMSLNEIKSMIKKVNNLEVKIKTNSQISNQILNNFIIENLKSTNSVI